MDIDSQFTAADLVTNHPHLPQPGEIWEVSSSPRHPLLFSLQEMQRLYSEVAREFLAGELPTRYVMIVQAAESELEEQKALIVSVMVLSEETQFLSHVDLLIPAAISGIDRDLLAETWQVVPMLACNLSRPVGKRLSREVYDMLLDVGDAELGLLSAAPSPVLRNRVSLEENQEISAFCQKKPGFSTDAPEIQAFHQREQQWSEVLSVPLAAYRTYQKKMALTKQIAEAALEVERELATISRMEVNLSQWLQNLFNRDWLSWESFWAMPGVNLAWGTRNSADFPHLDSEKLEEIETLVARLAEETDEHQQRKIAEKLGKVASGYPAAITALVHLIKTTQNDETLWTAVENLWRLAPNHPAAGTRRVKLIDWGLEIAGNAVALAVAVVPKFSDRLSVLLRVYSASERTYLPTGLKLILLDESGEILREVSARKADIFLQLKLSGKPEEKFSVRVALGEASITEDFML